MHKSKDATPKALRTADTLGTMKSFLQTLVLFAVAASQCLAEDFDWPKSRRERGRLEQMARAGDSSFRTDPSWTLVIEGVKRAQGTTYEVKSFDERTLVLLEDPETVAKVFAAYRSGDLMADRSVPDAPGIVKYLAEDFFRGAYKYRSESGTIPRMPIEHRSAFIAMVSVAGSDAFNEATRAWARSMDFAISKWCYSGPARDGFFVVLRSWWNDNKEAMTKGKYAKVGPGCPPPPPPAQHASLRQEFFKWFPDQSAIKEGAQQSPVATTTAGPGRRSVSWIWVGAVLVLLVAAELILLGVRHK
jgi:hypothetical protein